MASACHLDCLIHVYVRPGFESQSEGGEHAFLTPRYNSHVVLEK